MSFRVKFWLVLAAVNALIVIANLAGRDWSGAFTSFVLASLNLYIALLLMEVAQAKRSAVLSYADASRAYWRT